MTDLETGVENQPAESVDSAILVVGPSWVGDLVMAQSFFIALKQQQPNVAIDVLASGWLIPLLARMPQIRSGIENPLKHGQLGLVDRRRLGKKLNGHYQRAYLLPNSFKSAMIPFWAGINQRIGYAAELRSGLLTESRKLDKKVLTRTVERFVALAYQPGEGLPEIALPRLPVNPVEQQATLKKLGFSGELPPVLALCPGAEYGPAKRWPVEHFAQVARDKLAQGWQVWIFGSAKDRPVAQQINDLTSGQCKNLAGTTSLAEACDLLALAAAVVTNDSGLMHVAAALGRRLFCLFGSSDPRFTPPLSDSAEVFSLDLSCSPCFERECPLGHFRCLNDLLPEQVSVAIG
ncbi:MAG: lipopolysaccharide heptosyltransferase II [Immundisolibacteraceae bacterium]|nr:lipopolysaccharide heptosyltransferase II [Immundisolibacteraceae bacterium]